MWNNINEVKMKWKCDKCNDSICYCERINEDKKDVSSPGIVKQNICLVGPSFKDAEWKVYDATTK